MVLNNIPRLLLNLAGGVCVAIAFGAVVKAYIGIRSTPLRQPTSMKCAVHADGASRGTAPCVIWQPSMLQLLARPEFFHGKLVEVVGYVHFEFEDSGIHVHREDFERGFYDQALWLGMPTGEAQACQDSYARVRGRFDAHRRGHMGLNAGSIDEVSLCEAIPSTLSP